MTHFDVHKLRLAPGQEYRDALELELPAFEFGGERYIAVPERVPAQIVVTRAVSGTLFALSFDVRLHGPCHRCLDDAVLDVAIRVTEYQADADDDEELRTPYLVDGELAVSEWGRDAVALALPDKILCRPDCAGLCPVCGENRNEHPHEHENVAGDPRWAALEALRDEL